jgi:hypothetical protein
MLRGQAQAGSSGKRMPLVPTSMQVAFINARNPQRRSAALLSAREVFAGLRGVAMGSSSENQVNELFVAASTLAEVEMRYGEHVQARGTLESTLDLLPSRDLRDRIRPRSASRWR